MRCRRRWDRRGRAAEAARVRWETEGWGQKGTGGRRGVCVKVLGQVGCPTGFGELGDPRLDLGDLFKEGSRSALRNPSEKQHAGCYSSLLLMAIT